VSTDAAHQQGKSFPLGATLVEGGANFSVFAKHSTGAQLLLFDDLDAQEPSQVIDLDPRTNRTYHYWHVFVPGVTAGQLYAYRVAGPYEPARGLRFDPTKVLLDPYARCIARPAGRSREAARRPGDNSALALRSVVVDPSGYDWEGDAPLGRPFAKTIIYEMHVGGFTRHPSSGVASAKRGTYAGLIDKIPCLRDLGISAVELLPVFGSTNKTRRRASRITGVINRSRFSRHIRVTALDRTRSARTTSFATWSRRCIAPVSRSSSTSSTITPQRGTPTVRPSASADWRMTPITS
jgi:pullulanase/glycogen debranching enzyme